MIIILGILCIIISFIFKVFPPKINSVFGYKSRLAMKNEDTWSEALKYSSNTFIMLGLIFIPLQFILSKFSLSYNLEGIVIVICLGITVIINELHLRKIFNSNGVRK